MNDDETFYIFDAADYKTFVRLMRTCTFGGVNYHELILMRMLLSPGCLSDTVERQFALI